MAPSASSGSAGQTFEEGRRHGPRNVRGRAAAVQDTGIRTRARDRNRRGDRLVGRPACAVVRLVILLVRLAASRSPLALLPSLARPRPPRLRRSPRTQLQPGQKAVVKTVFQGDTIEEFEAEIVGVLKGGRAEGDMILARATAERVEHDGHRPGHERLARLRRRQARSARSPRAGSSRASRCSASRRSARCSTSSSIPSRPATPTTPGRPGPSRAAAPPSGVRRLPLAGRRGRCGRPRRRWRPRRDPRTGAPTPLRRAARVLRASIPGALDLVAAGSQPLGFTAVPGGRAHRRRPRPRRSSPARRSRSTLMRGDLQFSAIGTVTWTRRRPRARSSAIPFFQSGDVRLPLSTAEIATDRRERPDLVQARHARDGRSASRRRTAAPRSPGTARWRRRACCRFSCRSAATGRSTQHFRFETHRGPHARAAR